MRLAAFRAALAHAHDLVSAAHRVDAAGAPLWNTAQQEAITEAAYLGLFIAWEAYLEGALIDYMLGEQSIRGRAIARWVSPASSNAACAMLIGTQKYVDYANPDIVRKLAKIMLAAGGPFEQVLSGIHADLLDMKTIRNATAHFTSTAATSLEALANRKLGAPQRSGITPYQLLVAIDPDPAAPAGSTFLLSYSRTLEAAAVAIADA